MSTGTNGVDSSVSDTLDFELEDIKYTGNQQFSDFFNRRVPRDDGFWHKFDEIVLRLVEKLNWDTRLRLDYNQVMLEHKDWRERIFEAAMVLFQAKTGKEPDLEQFVWALLHLSHVVREICMALLAWYVTDVDLSKHFATPHGKASPLSIVDMKTAEDVMKAIEKREIIDTKGPSVAVALDVALFSKGSSDVQKWISSRMAAKQKARAEGWGHEAAEQERFLARRSIAISNILRQMVANQLEQANNPLDGNCCLLDSMMSDPSFFKDKTDICAAYIKSSRILEVYKVHKPEGCRDGQLELIAVKHNVHGLSSWHDIAQQDFHLGSNGLLMACVEGQMNKSAWDMDMRQKWHWRGREYVPRKVATTKGGSIVAKAMEEIVPKSKGGWTFLMRGQSMGIDKSKEGFQTLEMCTVAAGLSLRFNSSHKGKYGQAAVVKEAYWHTYDNIKVNQHLACLTVGHWVPNAPSRSRSDGATKVSIIAAKNSLLWGLESMWT